MWRGQTKTYDWSIKVDIDAKLQTNYDKTIHMMTKFESQWDDRLGRLNVAKPLNELVSNQIVPVYCSFPVQGQAQVSLKKHISITAGMGVFE